MFDVIGWGKEDIATVTPRRDCISRLLRGKCVKLQRSLRGRDSWTTRPQFGGQGPHPDVVNRWEEREGFTCSTNTLHWLAAAHAPHPADYQCHKGRVCLDLAGLLS